MAEPLKNNFGQDMVHRAAVTISRVFDEFNSKRFTSLALDGYDELGLLARCRQIADAMADFLPADRERAINILIDSLGPELENCDPDDAMPTGDPDIDDNPMSGFFYQPHGYFVADHCTDHFEASMRANYEITKRHTSEFSIRTPLRDDTDRTLAVLEKWAHDDNVHVRRLVSEGSRPRLPWSFRLNVFEADPAPVMALLELLKDDPVEYVRRSVANNLNDIAKAHPQKVIELAEEWWADGDHNRRRLVRHGLRTLVKTGDSDALAVLGYGADSPVRVSEVNIAPADVAIGEKVRVEVSVENPTDEPAGALVDLIVHFVKANGTTSPKVFKGAELMIGSGELASVRKTISLAQHTTRTHYPGVHTIEIAINGTTSRGGQFTLK